VRLKTLMNEAWLKRKLSRAQVVSLDVFDTAVLRNLDEPVSLFRLMLPRVSGILGNRTPEFVATRIFSERAARVRAFETTQAEEVGLAEIYRVLCELLDVDRTNAEEFCRLEIEAELAVCCANPAIQAVYRRCLDQNKTVVFLSDMYLPATAIGEILQKCGYSKYDALFVSSEFGKTKASGRLYEEALGRVAVAPRRWLHIGDNRQSDVRKARQSGLATWHYLSVTERFKQDRKQFEAWRPSRPSSTAECLVKGLLAKRFAASASSDASDPERDFWEDFGYSTAGPLYAGFTEWLIEQAAESELDTIYFLARDGYLVQRLFETYRPPELSQIDTKYLYASRRSLKLAAIEDIDERTSEFLSLSFSLNEVGTFLVRIGLDPQAYLDDIKRAGFRNESQIVRTRRDFDRLSKLIKTLKEPILERARSERAVMLSYLESVGLSDGRSVALVDIGWQGSQQWAIHQLFHREGRSVRITGWFLGTFWFAENLFGKKLSHEAYLFRLGQPREYQDLVLGCVEICELLFSAPEGSLIYMDRLPTGGFVPICQPIDADEAIRNKVVERLQAGATQFVSDYFALKKEFPELTIDPETAIAQLRRLLRNPTLEEAVRLGDIPHTKDFGQSTRGPIAQRWHLLGLLRRRREIRWQEGPWRAGIEARSSRLYRALYRLRMGDKYRSE
jgi:predicted HAD superfamily hydrolase